MNIEINKNEAFPTDIFSCFHPNYLELNKKLLKDIYEIESEEKNLSKSNMGGFHSNINLHLDKRFESLCKFILNICNTIIYNDTSYELYANYKYTVKEIKGMWFIINRYTDYNKKHFHPNTWLSGAYYLKTPDKASNNIIFDDPVACRTYTENFSANSYRIEVEEGLLVLFPGWLKHSVKPNLSKKDRVVVSFNVDKPIPSS